MGNKYSWNNKKVTIPIQKFNLSKKFKKIITNTNSNSCIDIDMILSPTYYSREYEAKLIYKSLNEKPHLYINMKSFSEIEDINLIPHNYGVKTFGNKKYLHLCLWYRKEWDGTEFLSDTIIPWGIEWLLFYEIWLITGTWEGGGIKHNNKKI